MIRRSAIQNCGIVAAMLVLGWAAASCATTGYFGATSNPSNTALFKANRGTLFSIDGVWGTNFNSTYSGRRMNRYSTKVEMQAGEHTFVFNDRRTNSVYQFTAEIKPGHTYKLVRGTPLRLLENGVPVDGVTFEKVSVPRGEDGVFRMTEERDDSKVAYLEYKYEDHHDLPANFYLRVVDNVWGQGLLNGFGRMLDGNFRIALAPGEHTMKGMIFHTEYGGYATIKQTAAIGVVKHTFEAGKTYTILAKSVLGARIYEVTPQGLVLPEVPPEAETKPTPPRNGEGAVAGALEHEAAKTTVDKATKILGLALPRLCAKMKQCLAERAEKGAVAVEIEVETTGAAAIDIDGDLSIMSKDCIRQVLGRLNYPVADETYRVTQAYPEQCPPPAD